MSDDLVMTVFGQKPSAALAVRDVQKDAARQSAETDAAIALRCFFMCGTPLQNIWIQRMPYPVSIVKDETFLHNSQIAIFWLKIAIMNNLRILYILIL